MAGDLFNGNRDRFDPYAGEKEMHASPHTITFQCTVNPGNIIFVRGGDGKYRPSMADYADPSSLSKDLDEESDRQQDARRINREIEKLWMSCKLGIEFKIKDGCRIQQDQNTDHPFVSEFIESRTSLSVHPDGQK